METFISRLDVRWADIDANFHVLHSKYYDYAATCRMEFLTLHGLSMQVMQEYHIGPILFREECSFKKEIRFGDQVSVTFKVSKASENFARWSIEHEIYKNGDQLAAITSIDAAWMDTQRRKLVVPPPVIQSIFEKAPKSENFHFISGKK
ncbi:MAG: acyl-CoA thioesterase [Ferruginibacter sp.]